jgi:hypothetical protein
MGRTSPAAPDKKRRVDCAHKAIPPSFAPLWRRLAVSLVRQVNEVRHDLPIGGQTVRLKPISQSCRLENSQRMGKNFVGRATGIDLNDDCEQAGDHVCFPRRAEKSRPSRRTPASRASP